MNWPWAGSLNGRPRYTITANDEPDGTVYFLADPSGKYIAMADWPHPLEQLAQDRGGYAERVASNVGEHPPEWITVGPRPRLALPDDPVEIAAEWLAALLAGGPVPILDIARARLKVGVKVQHMNRAAKLIGVEKHTAGRRFVVGGGAASGTRGSFGVWCLPGQWTKGWMPERSPVEQKDEVVIEVDEVTIPEDELTPEERARARLMDTIEQVADEPIDRQAVGLPERMEELPVAVVHCKVDGCQNAATGTGTFTGLCDEHKSEEASRRNRLGWERRHREGVETEPADDARGAGVIQARSKPRASKPWKASEVVTSGSGPSSEEAKPEVEVVESVDEKLAAGLEKQEREIAGLAVLDNDEWILIAKFTTSKDALEAARLLLLQDDDGEYVVVWIDPELLA